MLALLLALQTSPDAFDLKKQMGDEIFAAAGLQKLSAKELSVLSRFVFALQHKGGAAQSASGHSGKIADLLNGIIIASDGRVLGKISREPMDPDSIANDIGAFGRKFGNTSMMSKLSPYGDTMSDMSAFNPNASTPPRVFIGDKAVAFVTVNPKINPRVDTKQLLLFLGISQ